MSSPARLQLISLARRFIPETEGPVTIVIRAAGVRVVIEETPEDGAAPSVQLSPVERSAIRVATESPQSAKALARKAGYRCNTHFRAALTSLVRKSLLQHGPDGYAQPSRQDSR